jgi:hypothetical protein
VYALASLNNVCMRAAISRFLFSKVRETIEV